MKSFMDDDFLLDSEAAKRLYHGYAQGKPILDFHSHLPPEQVAQDLRFDSLAKLWLGGDHYKWRAMRSNGVPEELVTGSRSWEDKFAAWARTVPATIGNPLYHWTHLELRRYFGINEVLGPITAASILAKANAQLGQAEFTVRGLLRQMNVRLLATTDDPADDLAWHRAYRDELAAKPASAPQDALMVPTLRPDKLMAVQDAAAWNAYLAKLGQAAGLAIGSFAQLVSALERRHTYFHDLGCRLSDHALEVPPAQHLTDAELDSAFARLKAGTSLEGREAEGFRTAILTTIGRLNQARGWTMQLHIGAIRNLSSRRFAALGPDTGYDAINDQPIAKPLGQLLDLMEREGNLPRTILYTLNPAANEVLGTVMGCFQDGSSAGKIQFGSGWWFNDQLDGMLRQLTALSQLGLLSRFVGMLTDSRSFLSFPRHEYFRRLLCNLIGGWVASGQAPADFDLLGNMVEDICWRNAARQFNFPGIEAPATGA